MQKILRQRHILSNSETKKSMSERRSTVELEAGMSPLPRNCKLISIIQSACNNEQHSNEIGAHSTPFVSPWESCLKDSMTIVTTQVHNMYMTLYIVGIHLCVKL